METSMKRDTTILLAGLLIGSTVGAAIGTVTLANADNDRATSDVLGANKEAIVVPYDGFLMLDSSPLNGAKNLRFKLYEQANPNTLLWQEDHAVTLTGGRFSIGLGTGTRSGGSRAQFADVILSAEKLELAIEVESTTPNTYVALSGRQTIEAVPYAAWSTHSDDLQVAGDAEIDGGATVGGFLNVKDTDILLGTDNPRGRGNGGRALVQDTNDTLVVNFGNDFSGGTEVRSDFGTSKITGLSSSFGLRYWGTKARETNSSTTSDLRITSAGTVIAENNALVRGISTFTGQTTHSGGIDLGSNGDIRDADQIGGTNDLRFYGSNPSSSTSTPDLLIASSGSVTATKNLTVQGDLNVQDDFITISSVYSASRPDSAGTTEVNIGTTNRRFGRDRIRRILPERLLVLRGHG